MGSLLFLTYVLIFASSSSLLPLLSHAADTLNQSQSIQDGTGLTIVSSGQLFELGFFSPDGSSNRYVGIWYYGVVPQAVVWVANREAPLNGSSSSGSFGISGGGNLVVLDGTRTLWTSNSSSTVKNSTYSVQLRDSGNLVLQSRDSDGNANLIWQSFDFPTDTFLPDMKIKSSHTFRSWRSRNDPSSGNYTVGIGPNGSAQIYMSDGPAIRWRSGQWNGQSFIGARVRPLFTYGFRIETDQEGRQYFTFTAFNTSLYRFVIQWDGVENATILVNDTKQWGPIWSQPIQECDFYNKCGANAVCTDAGTPVCGCLEGYVPASAVEWSKGNWTSGCSRRTPLGCERTNGSSSGVGGDGFLKVEGVKPPDLHEWRRLIGDAAGCEAACLTNCSCKAYAYVNGCWFWGSDLVDIHRLSDGGGADVYIKLAGSELDRKSKKWIAPVVVAIVGLFILMLLCLFLLIKFRGRLQDWRKNRRRREASIIDFHRPEATSNELSVVSDVGDSGKDGSGSDLPVYSLETIVAATNGFSDADKLGRGGFGDVYKGVLPGGEEIAVKRLSRSSGQGQEEFKNEVILIAKLQHRNLVRLMGCCIEREEKILVYEYLPNKSLDSFLFRKERKAMLDWKKRFDIVEGIARGLLYLHRDSRLRIVHRDLKASNILLDGEMNPKISDFGMARIFGGDQNQENTNRVVGTYGYMSPEYAMEGLFSVKSDVYSFGVLMLEIISGRKNNSFRMSSETTPNLVAYAWSLWHENRARDLIDPSIRDSVMDCEVMRCIHVGLLCVQDRPVDRPIMSSVVLMLGSETTILVMPKQPTFALGGTPSETESRGIDQDMFTSSDVTISTITGR